MKILSNHIIEIMNILCIFVYITISFAVFRIPYKKKNKKEEMIYNLIFLIFSFFLISVLLLLCNVQFIGLLYIIIYIGAILILFLFIIMLLDYELLDEKKIKNKFNYFNLFFIFFFISSIIINYFKIIYYYYINFKLYFFNNNFIKKYYNKIIFKISYFFYKFQFNKYKKIINLNKLKNE